MTGQRFLARMVGTCGWRRKSSAWATISSCSSRCAKPWFPIKAASPTWWWFWKFHFSWKCSKMVLQFWFADNQHYKFGKKPRCPAASDLLSPGAVSSSAVGLGAARPATAPGQCGGGSLYRKGEESGSSPALPLRRMPTRLSDLGFHISEVPSSPSYSTDSDYASIRSMCVTSDKSHKHHALDFTVWMFSGAPHGQLATLYAKEGMPLINPKQTPLSHFGQLCQTSLLTSM